MNSHHVTGSSSNPLPKSVTDAGTTAPKETTVTPQSTPTQAPKEATPLDFQVAEGIDILGGETVTQRFLSTHQGGGPKTPYSAELRYPKLPEPKPEGQEELLPYEPDVKRAIKNKFTERMRAKLKEKPKESQTELAAETTKEIQQAFGLRASWSLDSKPDSIDWTPIKKVDLPVDIDMARKEFLTANIEELLEAFSKAGKKVSDSLLPDDPNRLAVNDFISAISKAIRELKGILQQLQMQKSDVSIKLADAKLKAIEERTAEIEEQAKKNEEIRAEQERMQNIKFIVKVCVTVVSILATIAGAVLAVVSAGALTPLAIAGIAVAASISVYSGFDLKYNLTQQAMEALDKALEAKPDETSIEETNSIEDQAWKKTMKKTAIIAFIVAILVAATILTGGGAAANVATQTASQIAKQAVMETIKQLSTQAIMITIMSSNIIPELFTTILIEAGALDRNNKEEKMWWEVAIMVVTMIVTMAVMTGGKGMWDSIKGIGKGVVEGTQAIGKFIVDTAKSMFEAIKSLKDADLIESLSRMLTSLMAAAANAGPNMARAVQEIFQDIINIKEIFKSLENFKKFVDEGQGTKLLSDFLTIVKIAGLSTEVATGCILAGIGFQIARLLRELGEIEKAQEIIKMLIKLFDQLLNSIHEDMTKTAEWLQNLQQTLDSTYSVKQQISARAAHVQG